MMWGKVLHNKWDLDVRKDKNTLYFCWSCDKMVKMVHTGSLKCSGEREKGGLLISLYHLWSLIIMPSYPITCIIYHLYLDFLYTIKRLPETAHWQDSFDKQGVIVN